MNGIGMLAVSPIELPDDLECRRFVAWVGVYANSINTRGPNRFRVYADGKLVAFSNHERRRCAICAKSKHRFGHGCPTSDAPTMEPRDSSQRRLGRRGATNKTPTPAIATAHLYERPYQ